MIEPLWGQVNTKSTDNVWIGNSSTQRLQCELGFSYNILDTRIRAVKQYASPLRTVLAGHIDDAAT